MLSAPVSGVATRNATVAPGVAPCLRRPSAVGSTPQEHKGNGAPRTDAQRTDLTRPVPTRRTNNPLGTRTASAPAKRKPKIRKTEASFRISQVSQNTPDISPIITTLLAAGVAIYAVLSLRQVFIAQSAGHGILGIDDIGHVNVGRLSEQFDRVVPVETVVLHQPIDHRGAGKAQRVDQGPSAADGHDLIVGDHVRPVDLLSLDQ